MVRTAAASFDSEVVLRILTNSTDFPAEAHTASSRSMLADGLRHALPSAGAAELHGFQRQFLGLVSGALAEVRQAAQAALEATAGAAAEAERRLGEAEAAKQAAAATTESASNALASQQQKLADAESAVAVSSNDSKELEKAKDAVVAQRSAVKEKREAIAAVSAAIEAFERDETTVPATDKVMEFFSTGNREKALLAAAPAALQLKPTARGAFDVLTVEEVKRLVAESLASVEEQLAATAKEEEYATAEALGEWAVLDCARDGAMALRLLVAEAEGALASAKADEKGAALEADAVSNGSTEALSRRVIAEQRVKDVEAAIDAFERCSNPAPAEPADVPMEEGAAAAAEAKE